MAKRKHECGDCGKSCKGHGVVRIGRRGPRFHAICWYVLGAVKRDQYVTAYIVRYKKGKTS